MEHARSAYLEAVAERDRAFARGERPPPVPPLAELLGHTAATWRVEGLRLLSSPHGRVLE